MRQNRHVNSKQQILKNSTKLITEPPRLVKYASIIIVIAISYLSILSKSVDASGDWIKILSSIYGVYPTSITTTTDGGYLVSCGSVIKLNSAFEIEWERTYSLINSNYDNIGISSSLEIENGHFILGGGVSSYGCTFDSCILEIDKNGTQIRSFTYVGISGIKNIIKSLDGGYILSGGKSYGCYSTRITIIKLTQNFEIDWQIGIGGWDSDVSIVLTKDNALLVNSYTALYKVDMNGTILWSKTYSGYANNSYDYRFIHPQSLMKTQDGNIILLGTGYITYTYSEWGYIIKIDEDGNTIWARSYPQMWMSKIVEDVNGNLIAAGVNRDFYIEPDYYYIQHLSVFRFDSFGNFYSSQKNIQKEYNFDSSTINIIKSNNQIIALSAWYGENNYEGRFINLGEDAIIGSGCDLIINSIQSEPMNITVNTDTGPPEILNDSLEPVELTLTDIQFSVSTHCSSSQISLALTPFYPQQAISEVNLNDTAIRHYTVTENGQVLKGQFATVTINGQQYQTPWQRTSDSDLGGVQLTEYANSDKLWVAVDTQALGLGAGEYVGQITAVGGMTLSTPVQFTVKVLGQEASQCYLGHSWKGEVSFGKQIGVGIKGVVEAETNAAVYLGGEDLLYIQLADSGSIDLERHYFLEGGGKIGADLGFSKKILDGKLSLADVEGRIGVRPSFVEKSRYSLPGGLDTQAAFTADFLDHFGTNPLIKSIVEGLRIISGENHVYEQGFAVEAFISQGVSLGPKVKFTSSEKEETISLDLLNLGESKSIEIGKGWNDGEGRDWTYGKVEGGLASGGIISFDSPVSALGVYRHKLNGLFDKYSFETQFSQDFSTSWTWPDSNLINFPVADAAVAITDASATLNNLQQSLAEMVGQVAYEKNYEKQRDGEIGLDIKLLLGAEISAKLASLVRSPIERGVYYGGSTYPSVRSATPSDSICALTFLEDEVIKPAIEAVKERFFSVYNAVGEKNIQILKDAATESIRVQLPFPLNLSVTSWDGFWETQVSGKAQMTLKDLDGMPVSVLGAAPTGTTYGVGGFYHLAPEETVLTAPATITIAYNPLDLGSFSEATLQAYRWDSKLNAWRHAGGSVDLEDHAVSFSIVEFGTYTLAPRIPADSQFVLTPSEVGLPADGASTCSVESGIIATNDGTTVEDGTFLTVKTQDAGGMGDVGCGSITTLDQDDSIDGIQIGSQNGRITFSVQAPSAACLARVVARSVVGGAWGECQVDFSGGQVVKKDPAVPPEVVHADFTGQPTAGLSPLTVQFTDGSSGDITQWLWDFGDGGFSTEQHPAHLYSALGTYAVQLQVTGTGGTDTAIKSSFVQVTAPRGYLSVTLSPTSAVTAGARWRVDGGPWQASAAAPSNLVVGQHTVEFMDVVHWGKPVSQTVEILDGETAQLSGTYEPLFVPGFSVSQEWGKTPLRVAFIDNSVGAHGWLWEFGDGKKSTRRNPIHLYQKPGCYTVKLTITWADDTSTATAVINAFAVPRAYFTATPTKGYLPLPVTFTDKSKGSITSWTWNFGDGSQISQERNPTHTFKSAGAYKVTLTTTGQVGSSTITRVVTVNKP